MLMSYIEFSKSCLSILKYLMFICEYIIASVLVKLLFSEMWNFTILFRISKIKSLLKVKTTDLNL